MEAFQKIHPLEFYKKFLEKSVRPDGRPLDKARKTTISNGSVMTADGSSFVKIGNTSVIAGVKAEVAETTIDNVYTKKIFVNIEMGPICSNVFSSTKPSEKAMSLCSQLNSLVNRLDIDQKDLYFDKDGKYSWYLYVDLYCLDYNGNILDASILAMLSALKDVKLPVGIVEQDGEFYKDLEQPLHSLNIGTSFIPLTFAIINEYVLVDPTLDEEKLALGTITITFDNHFNICMLLYTGISSITDDTLFSCIEMAKHRFKEIQSLIN